MMSVLRILFAVAFLVTGHIQAARAETITLVADGWCPYNCEPNADRPGFIVELAKEAFSKHGIEVKYDNLPWARAIEETRQNRYTGIIGAYYGDAPDFIYPDVPQGVSSFSFYVNSDDPWRYEDVSSLNRRTLGVINDYNYSVDLDAYIEHHRQDTSRVQILSGDNAIDNNVRKLLMRRIDTFIEDRLAMAYFLAPEDYKSVRDSIREAGMLPANGDEDGIVFIAFSPKNPESKRYAKILSDETRAMSRSGRLSEILARYNIEPFDPEKAK